jgi:hypothetical protein
MSRPDENPRLRREARTVEAMIAIFCRGRHGGRALCAECEALRQYAQARLERCRFGPEKPVCVRCPVHCYRPDLRAQIREVMIYAGPRMLLRHPVLAVRHLLDERRDRGRCAGETTAGGASSDPPAASTGP